MLKTMHAYVTRRLQHFARQTEGGLSVEAIMVFPLLMWAYMGMFFYFDAYRQQNVNLKAAYTVSDLLSRNEGRTLDWDYLNGVNTFFDYLTTSSQETTIRVTSVWYDADHYGEGVGRFMLDWSRGTRGLDEVSQFDLDSFYKDEIPQMANGATAIIVETWAYYDPVVNIGLPSVTFDNLIVTSLRFSPQLCWEVCGELGSGSTHDDNTDDGADDEPDTT